MDNEPRDDDERLEIKTSVQFDFRLMKVNLLNPYCVVREFVFILHLHGFKRPI